MTAGDIPRLLPVKLFLLRVPMATAIPEVSTEFPAIGQSLQLWYPKAHFVIRNYHRMEN